MPNVLKPYVVLINVLAIYKAEISENWSDIL